MSYRELDGDYEGDELQMLRDEVHRFAAEEIRPAARELDAMPHDEYVEVVGSGDSPFRDVMRGLKRDLGAHRAVVPEPFGGGGMTGREFHVLMEELAWGSSGLAIGFGVDILPPLFAAMTFDQEVREQYVEPYMEDTDGAYQGCWGVTEPSHGSEHVQADTLLRDGVEGAGEGGGEIGPPECTAEKEGDEWVIDGAKASWVTAAPLATHCALHVNMDPQGGDPGGLVFVPLDRDGVTRGPPIDKLGQRDAPQGELVFDEVRIPEEYMVLEPPALHPDTAMVPFTQVLCLTSAGMSAVATGIARAAFEEALAYAREREQGGKPIWRHQSVKGKLYDMFEKVETARAYSRRVCEHVWDRNLESFEFDASHRHAVAGQVYCKRIAFEVAHEALQIHGANGITKDYLVEKLFRDARVKLIEDGTVEVLGLESAHGVVEHYELSDRR
jgi:alkylation response protein AidB-like acyl-CoA dehydrogenase